MGSTLVVGIVLTWGAALLFARVGARTWRRRIAPEMRLANGAFSLWWASAAAVLFSLGLPNLLGLLGVVDDGVHASLLYARMAPMALALGSLMYYFTFLLTGARRAWVPAAAAYAAFWAYGVWLFARMGPWTTVVTTWDVRAVPAGSWTDPAAVAFGLLLGAPVLVAGLGYLSLAVSDPDPLVRYRIVLVASGVVAVFAVVMVSFAMGWPGAEWFPLLYQPAGLAAGVLGVLAFSPPAWVRLRLGGAPAEEPRRSPR